MNERSGKPTLEMFAMAAPGLEPPCADELNELKLGGVKEVFGGVEFHGSLGDLYRANLWARIPSRILVRVGECRSRDFPKLFRQAVKLPWGRFIRPGTPLTTRVSSRRSRLGHSDRIAATASDAVSRSLGGAEADLGRPQQLVFVRVEEDRAVFSVDSSGELLHRRGYRTGKVPAPLRETLAAGMLRLLGWDHSMPLIDPMCGSGTLPIEAQLWALGIPPGRKRSFSFMHWPRYRDGLWRALLLEADRSVRDQPVLVRGSDRDPAVIAAARNHAEKSGVAPFVQIQNRAMEDLEPLDGPGLIVCNPPYGRRLGREDDLAGLYRDFGSICRERFPGWRVGFLCPEEDQAAMTGLPVKLVCRLRNGGVSVGLFRADLP